MGLTEEEICLKIRDGDEKTFNLLFNDYYSSLCRYAYDILHDTEVSKEIVLDIFVNIWESRDSFKINYSLRGYMYRVVHNKCLNYLRSLKAFNKLAFVSLDNEKINFQSLHFEVPPEIIEKLFSEQLELRLRQEMEALPAQCREIFYLSRFEDMTYPEIAEKLNLALSTVKTQMLRALTRLKSRIENFL